MSFLCAQLAALQHLLTEQQSSGFCHYLYRHTSAVKTTKQLADVVVRKLQQGAYLA
jgi:hypothetical protein